MWYGLASLFPIGHVRSLTSRTSQQGTHTFSHQLHATSQPHSIRQSPVRTPFPIMLGKSTRSGSTSSCLPTPPGTPPVIAPPSYIAGARFVAKRHDPPSPFGRHYPRLDALDIDVPEDASHLEWCLQHPPLPASTHSNDMRNIDIAQTVRTGGDCGAQVILT